MRMKMILSRAFIASSKKIQSGDNLHKEWFCILNRFDSSYKGAGKDSYPDEKQYAANQYSEDGVKAFGYFHSCSLFSLARRRMALSTFPPSFAALLSTCIFSVSSVV